MLASVTNIKQLTSVEAYALFNRPVLGHSGDDFYRPDDPTNSALTLLDGSSDLSLSQFAIETLKSDQREREVYLQCQNKTNTYTS